jgi:hypothetical protein
MKNRNWLWWLVFAVPMGLLFVAGLALAQVTVTPYTAIETFVALVDRGEMTRPDGNWHLRGYTIDLTRNGSDPRVSGGTLRMVVNFNHDKNFSGPVWGSARWEIGGGLWEGTFEGNTNHVAQVGYYDIVWHGSGEFRGLQVKETCVYTGTPIGTCTGRILETPSK